MNIFPAGIHVFYWDIDGSIKYGMVESTSRMLNGTQVVNICIDGITQHYSQVPDGAGGFITRITQVLGKIVSLSVLSVLKVN